MGLPWPPDVPPVTVPLPMLDLEPSAVLGAQASGNLPTGDRRASTPSNSGSVGTVADWWVFYY